MKSLFLEDSAGYSEDSFSLNTEITKVITPIFEKYRKLGYSPREISHVANLAILDIECINVLRSWFQNKENKK